MLVAAGRQVAEAVVRVRAFTGDDLARRGDRRLRGVERRPGAAQRDRHHAGTALCEHAFEQMRLLGAEVVEIGDPFHAPARALYEKLGVPRCRSRSATAGSEPGVPEAQRIRPVIVR